MAVDELLDLVGCISSSDDAIATFRLKERMFIIVNVAIYIAPAPNARGFGNSYCNWSRSETDRWRNSPDPLTAKRMVIHKKHEF